MRSYDVEAGRIRTRSLEAHIVEHCNLRCAGCCSHSPFLARSFSEPEPLAHDLARLRRVLRPTWFKLVGGEPLLHPRLLDFIALARAADIAETVSLTTNGFLLPRQPDAFWQGLDALTVSLYPAPALPAETRALIAERAERFGVEVNWKRQDAFVAMDRPAPCTDAAENARVFAGCWLRERCHTVYKGRFFQCTRPQHNHALAGGYLADGVVLHDGPGLADELRAYLTRAEPLASCRVCRGGDAATLPHRQLSAAEVAAGREALRCAL